MEYSTKISIITITYNSEKTLERTIQSIITQEYDNLEYIIVDGGSKDGTLDIIKKYEAHINKWISEPDNGIADAFNKGIKMATGEIIGIINSDDGLEPGALRALAESYEPDVDVYRGNVILWNVDSNARIKEVPSMHIPYAGLKINISHQGTFVKKSAYEKYGIFNEAYMFSMDYDLLLRFELAGAKFKYVDYDMAYFTLGGKTFTSYNSARRKETETIIRSNGGKWYHIWAFRIIKYTKVYIKKVVNIDFLLKLKNRK